MSEKPTVKRCALKVGHEGPHLWTQTRRLGQFGECRTLAPSDEQEIIEIDEDGKVSVPWREGPPLCTNCGESAKPHPAYADFVGPFCEGCWERLREYFAATES